MQRDCRRAEARAAVSLIGLLAVWARDGVVRREAGYCCGVRAASLGVCVHMVLYAVYFAVCAGRLAVCALCCVQADWTAD